MKEKILNFLLIFLLAFFVVNFFNKEKKVENISSVIVRPSSTSYTLPASPIINIANKTAKDISLNTCSDIKIFKDGESLSIIDKTKCIDLTIKSNTTGTIKYSDYFQKFQTGAYKFDLNISDKSYLVAFNIGVKGFIMKFLTFIFYAPIYNLMVLFLQLTGYSLGFSIILITILIRLFLLIPQNKMMVNQKKMQKIQPKIKAIQDKYKGNHQVLGQEMMKLYKEEGVNPAGSCLPLLIQMPIMIVIYRVLLSINDVSNTFYTYSFFPTFDISRISYNFFGIDLLGSGGIIGIIAALTIGLLQFFQMKISMASKQTNKKGVVLEKKKGKTDYSQAMPDAETMNKFMIYGMPIMIAFFAYSMFVGIALYWGVGTTFMIAQQLFINKKTKK